MKIARLAAALPAVLTMLLTGCGGRKVEIVRYPTWDYAPYTRIAVLPVLHADERADGAAAALREELESRLAVSGVYVVASQAAADALAAERGLDQLGYRDDAADVLANQPLENTDAVIVVRLDTFDLQAEQAPITIPRIVRDEDGLLLRDADGRPRASGQRDVTLYQTAALVGADVRVIDGRTGAVAYRAALDPVQYQRRSIDAPPTEPADQLALPAARELAQAIARELAPTAARFEVDRDALIVSGPSAEGQWDDIDEAPATWSQLFIVVRGLPREAAQQALEISVTPREPTDPVLKEQFRWSGGFPDDAIAFALPVSRLTATGAEKFDVALKLVDPEQPLARRKFKLVQPDPDDERQDRENPHERGDDDRKERD